MVRAERCPALTSDVPTTATTHYYRHNDCSSECVSGELIVRSITRNFHPRANYSVSFPNLSDGLKRFLTSTATEEYCYERNVVDDSPPETATSHSWGKIVASLESSAITRRLLWESIRARSEAVRQVALSRANAWSELSRARVAHLRRAGARNHGRVREDLAERTRAISGSLARRVADGRRAADTVRARARTSARSDLLEVEASHGTNGAVRFERSSPDSEERRRCAALLRARSDDEDDSREEVVDVHVVANGPLSENFHDATASSPSGRVTGLLCEVPVDSLERFVMYGIGDRSTSWLRRRGRAVGDVWMPGTRSDTRSRADASSTSPFRYEFRRRVETAGGANERRTEDERGGDYGGVQEEERFVAVCKVFLLNDDDDGGGDVEEKGVVVGSDQGRVVRNPHHVLPEFVLRLRRMAENTIVDNGEWTKSLSEEIRSTTDHLIKDVRNHVKLIASQLSEKSRNATGE